MQGQPEIFGAVSLREIEREQEDGEDGKQDGVDETRQALEERAIRPEVEFARQIAGVAEVESAIGEEAGVRAVAEGPVIDAHREGERGFIGRHVQVVDARDGLIVLRRVAVRAFGLNMAAVGVDVGAGPVAPRPKDALAGDRQFDEKRKRPVVGRELDVETEPGVALRIGICGGFRGCA